MVELRRCLGLCGYPGLGGEAGCTATITVTSSADTSKKATCGVTVTGASAGVSGYLRPVQTIKAPPISGALFGASRDGGRYHAAADFAHYSGTPVYAATDGYITKYSYYWQGTCALIVENDDGTTFRYAEIQAAEGLGLITGNPADTTIAQYVHIRIERGDQIGVMYPNTDSGASMLHLEYYKGVNKSGTKLTSSLSDSSNSSTYDYVPIKNYQRRRDLLDPTPVYNLPTW